MLELIKQGFDFVRHLDVHLNAFAGDHPTGVYLLLAAIIFCETGLVVWPFLPGDSLLFAVGALAGSAGSTINLPLAMGLMCICANSGDLLNYSVGFKLGPKVFSRESSWFLNKKHLMEAERFYEKHGRKTIIMARFVPIVRTFAPFVAGVGKMPLARFIGFSISGGVMWVVLMTTAGYFFGGLAVVKGHFDIVVIAIVAISLIPVVVQGIQSRRKPATETVDTGN
jgi:membrane-associated protein